AQRGDRRNFAEPARLARGVLDRLTLDEHHLADQLVDEPAIDRRRCVHKPLRGAAHVPRRRTPKLYRHVDAGGGSARRAAQPQRGWPTNARPTLSSITSRRSCVPTTTALPRRSGGSFDWSGTAGSVSPSPTTMPLVCSIPSAGAGRPSAVETAP